MAARTGLGKGLDSLIPNKKTKNKESEDVKTKVKESSTSKNQQLKKNETNSSSSEGAEVLVKISKVEPDKNQPRKEFNEEALQELADSIKKYGIIQPIIVNKNGMFYQIIAGERRWRAAKLAGLKEIPVIIRDFDKQKTAEISIIENIQRENLNPIEEAFAYQRLIDEFHLTQESVAEKVSKSRVAVTNSLRLLKLNEKVRQRVIDGAISMGHARAILSVSDKDKQTLICKHIEDKKLSVRDTEKYISELKSGKKEKTSKVPKVSQQQALAFKEMEERLKETLNCNVKIHQKTSKKGQIEIEYYSMADLEIICNEILSLKKR